MTARNGLQSVRPQARELRCAIYTRKSTEEGLQQEFNSLDAQRESGESYVASQRHEGWVCVATRYDDGGYSGGNLDRPALRRLMADIEAGRIDCVVVYKVDRLSRSLLDFSRMMEVFDRHHVAFVSVTQAFNTSDSMGRLMLNVLLSFAQFEREIISERTRDKIAAARRKGKWSGGAPLLGYDIVATKLEVNEAEASMARQIFALYLEHGSLLPVVQELDRRGWRTKQWITKAGTERGGLVFNKTNLHALLTNPVYIGKVRHKNECFDGQHAGIVESSIFDRVQELLRRNGLRGGTEARNKHGALLRGILRCASCDAAMTHTFSTKANRRYRYYTCVGAQKRGVATCPSRSIPAAEIERFVVERIRCVGRDEKLVAETLRQVRSQTQDAIRELDVEARSLERELAKSHKEIALAATDAGVSAKGRLADLHERVRHADNRLAAIAQEIAEYERQVVDEDELRVALAQFDPVWEALVPREQARVIQLLVARVDYDGASGRLAMTFHPNGIRELAVENHIDEEAA